MPSSRTPARRSVEIEAPSKPGAGRERSLTKRKVGIAATAKKIPIATIASWFWAMKAARSLVGSAVIRIWTITRLTRPPK